MGDRRKATSTTSGILRPEALASLADIERVPCAPELAPWVENHWSLRWALPPGETYVSATLPHPACTLSVERGVARPEAGGDPVVVTGVVTRRFEVAASGEAWVHGVKFRPGGLAALLGVDARALADATVPAARLFPAAVCDALRALPAGAPAADNAARVDALLAPLAPADPDPSYDTVLAVVADVLHDRGLTRVDQLVARHHLSRRQLERLFARYVGVGPKWVLARYRMHDVVSELDAGYHGPLTDLAARYGWYDQAHFIRDFAALVGETPGAYRARGAGAGGLRRIEASPG